VRTFGWNHQAALIPADAHAGMQFGRAIDVSGDWAIVGAPLRNGFIVSPGAAYFFHRVNGAWVQANLLSIDNPSGGEHAGDAVAIDGDYAIYGVPLASLGLGTATGYAAVATRIGNVWTRVAYIVSQPYEMFNRTGTAVGVRGDLFMFSTPGGPAANVPGAGYISLTHPSAAPNWTPETSFHAADPQPGAHLGESADLGDNIVVGGAPDYDIGITADCGAVYVFEPQQLGIWVQTARIDPPSPTPSANFGATVRIDGNRIVITEPGTGKVYVYRKTVVGTWMQEWRLNDPFDLGEGFGFSAALSGDKVLVGSPLGEVQNLTSAGWAHVFDVNNGNGADASVFAPAVAAGTYHGCTQMATNDGDTTCGNSNNRRDVWYRYTAPCAGVVTFDTLGSDFDTVLSVHTALPFTAGPTIACNDNLGQFFTDSRLELAMTADQTVVVRVSGNNDSGGNFTLHITGCQGCYPNCDLSTAAPVLNVQDFACFLNKFAAGDPYANCDGSTIQPTLNVQDFACFLNRFAGGCS
jgi:hypothetical protein